MDGCIFCIKRASVMDNVLWLIFVCIAGKAFFGKRHVLVIECMCFGPPDARCIVRRRERVVVVIPM